MMYKRLLLVLGDQLFPDHSGLEPDEHSLFFMAEDKGLCTHFQYHKHKLVLFLSAMRQHAAELEKNYNLKYFELNSQNQSWSYEDKLQRCLDDYKGIEEIVSYEIEDHFFAERIESFCRSKNIEYTTVKSPGFFGSKEDFKDFLDEHKPFMGTYYKEQRKRHNLLLTEKEEPLKGQWSFDEDNRKKFPKDISFPTQPESSWNKTDRAVMVLVNQLFEDHPGNTDDFNFSTSRRSALHRLDRFLKERFEDFGPYEDAISKSEPHAFHSILSPYINMGLITAREVVDRAIAHYKENNTHYPSVEGFVRQIVGWREFLRGIYHHYDLEKNYFNHQRKMKDCWYDGSTGIPPLDDAIKKAKKHAYTHHIERLMVLGNIMLTTGLHPDEVYKWFMEMYADSADWVMAPNVYGMSQFAEGGIFATKPYLSGSNYILKMSDYSKGDWCDIVDGLYWRFIDQNKETFANNQRMSMMLATLKRMGDEKKERIFKAAEEWIERVSYR